MDNIIKQYFDKSALLKVKNNVYSQTLVELFNFQTKNDLVENDVTSKIINGRYENIEAKIISKQSGIIAGIEEIVYLIQSNTSLKVRKIVNDGKKVKESDLIFELYGKPLEILRYERTILNILQRMSGIATATHEMILKNNLKTNIAATRKTLWGLLDKKAVAIGGGLTHRLSLSDEILIKDNHIDLLAKKTGISRQLSLEKILIDICHHQNGPFEIEVENAKEAYFLNNLYQKADSSSALIIMLDNFSPKAAKKTIVAIRQSKGTKPIAFELSGGINGSNIKNYDLAGADVISVGALTNSSKSFDISLNFI